jgi:hypothetical protein
MFLAGVSAGAVLAAMPMPLAAAVPPVPVWIVGTPGEFDWQPFRARSAADAFRLWAVENNCDEEFDPDCVIRVATWDERDIEAIGPADWILAGHSAFCERCSCECHCDAAAVIGDDVVCDDCVTFAERCEIDPDDAVDDLANRLCDEGEAELRERLHIEGGAVPPELWAKAVALAGPDLRP